MSYNLSDINYIKIQIKQYYSFIKNDGLILTNFAKYLLSKADMNLENALINFKDMCIKDIINKLYDLTLELNTTNEISDIIKIKLDEENKKINDIKFKKNEIESKMCESIEIYKKYKNVSDIMIDKTKILEETYELLKDIEIKKLENYKHHFQLVKDIHENELITIKNTIDGIYKNEIYDNEYKFEESKYIIKDPCIHLDVDKILEDLKNNCCDIINICTDNLKFTCNGTLTKDHTKYIRVCYDYQSLNLNFPVEYILNDNEYIIKIFLVNNNISDLASQSYHGIRNRIQKIITIIYITNYGRIIKSNEIKFSSNVFDTSSSAGSIGIIDYTHISGNIIYNNKKTNINNFHYAPADGYLDYTRYYKNKDTMRLCEDRNKINLIKLPKLNYRIPRLFIDVIDAFHTMNTDLMQECCKKYLDITKYRDITQESEIKDIIRIKDIELEEQNKIIISHQEEINKLKDELIKNKNLLFKRMI